MDDRALLAAVLAAALAAVAWAQGLLLAFYCTDPYIPGYGRAEEAVAGVPYGERLWLDSGRPALRDPGCHRVILAEEAARWFVARGVNVELFEVDQQHEGGCHRREFRADAPKQRPPGGA